MRFRSPLVVGRDEELAALRRLLSDARGGRGGAVFLLGGSGLGKTRLAEAAGELAYTSGMGLMRGRASSIGPMAPFRPLAEAVLSTLRADPVDPAELGPYGPVLGRLVPGWGDPAAGRDGESLVVLAEAVLRLAGRVGRDRGCLLGLDDLQNADPETLAVLEYLVDNVDTQPVLVLGAVRDVDCPARALVTEAAQRGRCRLVRLHDLTRADLRSLAAACLDTDPDRVPAPVLEMLCAVSGGNPFVAEELVTTMVDERALTDRDGCWQVTERFGAAATAGLSRPLSRRVAQLGVRTRELLSVGGVLGPRFPLTVLQRVTGSSHRELLSLLQADAAGQLVAPDEQTADWYAFHHQLSREAVLALLDPDERAELAGTVADAVEAVHPGLPGEWCELAAALRLDAGDRGAAGRLFTEVGSRALAVGAATSAVALLDRAWELLARDDPAARAAALEQLVLALAETGEVERALDTVGLLDAVAGLTPVRRAELHTRLAWTLTVAGRTEDALAQVGAARGLLGPDAAPVDRAPIDVVAAHLTLDLPGAGRLAEAEELARRAATVAEDAPLPVVACQAWQLLGALTRHRDPDEATACLVRARTLAVRHGLPIWEIHALIRLGNDDALRDGGLQRLEQARDQASRVGAVTARYQAEASLALHSVLRGELGVADGLVGRVLAATTRLQLLETAEYVRLVRVVATGHRGDRRAMDEAVADFVRAGGDLELHAPRVRGLAGAFCALLEEDRPRAVLDLAAAVASEDGGSTVFHLSGRHGLHVLLDALTRPAAASRPLAVPAGVLRWDRQFALFARAVALGRAGAADGAEAALGGALQAGEPFPAARHLGLRLVAGAALDDGWGDPAGWLRTAEEYFHRTEVPAVAGACRALLRRAGVRVAQRRTGADGIPPGLRAAGVTVRELEVLRLLVGRLGNREIAERLHLSPRTVERHVSSLLTKLGAANRIALGEFAASLPAADGAAIA